MAEVFLAVEENNNGKDSHKKTKKKKGQDKNLCQQGKKCRVHYGKLGAFNLETTVLSFFTTDRLLFQCSEIKAILKKW